MIVRRVRWVLVSIMLLMPALVGLPQRAAALSVQNKTLISASPTGQPGNNSSEGYTFITPDARYIAYSSFARNLTNDVLPYPSTTRHLQAYVYDRQQHVTTLVSRNNNGDVTDMDTLPLGISDNGRYVLMQSVSNGAAELYLRDTWNNSNSSIPGSSGERGVMSGDGNIIAYGGIVYNRVTGDAITLPDNGVAFSLSDNGRYVAYAYYDSSNVGYVARYDRVDGTSDYVAQSSGDIRLTSDGSHISYGVVGHNAGSMNQLYFQDVATGERQLVFDAMSVSGDQYAALWGVPSVSDNGQIVAVQMLSHEYNRGVKRLWVANTATGELTRAQARDIVYTSTPSLTPDGSELVFNDYDVYGDLYTDIFEAHIDTTPANQAPAIAPLSPATISEGANFNEQGEITDPSSTSWSGTVDYGDGSASQALSISGSTLTLNHVYKDNGSYAVTVSVTDNQGLTSTATTNVTVQNVSPTVGAITTSENPARINTATTANATFTDPGMLDTHITSWDWGDGTVSTGTISENNGSGSVSGSHVYVSTGVYTVTLTVTDKDSSAATQTYQYVSVYNPMLLALFSGAVFFTSPTGAVRANPSLSGRVQFGITARYSNNQPTGRVNLTFRDANLTFDSTALSVLVISNDNATLRGVGTLNGIPDYSLLVTGVGGQANNQGRVRFQLKDPNGLVVYDTQPAAADTALPTTPVTGHIIVH